jgi:hypothetical protein
MSVWVGISPLIGAGSLDGFAVGATVSGAFFLAITASRRVRRRQAAAAGTPGVPRGVPVSASSAEAGAFDAGSFGAGSFGARAFDAGAFGAEAERVAQPQPGARDDASWMISPTGRDERAAAYRSRHRLGDAILGGALPDGAFRDGVSQDGVSPGGAARDGVSPGTFRFSRRPEVRRLPRHAAPTVSFGAKVSGRVTGLFAARPLAGGAPS